jgi:glycosyltransferase involved in cell wall biosynthesis
MGGADMAAPEVSIIIPSFHSLRTLGFTLRSVFAQQSCPSYEVLVVDSSGVDLTGWVRARYPQTRLIQPKQRHLPGAARNLGASLARGRVLAFLDADVIAEPTWLSILYDCLETRSQPAAVGGYVGNASPGGVACAVQHWLEFSEFVPGTASGPRRFLPTCNLLIRRDEFLDAGGFDPAWAMAEDLLFFQGLSRPAWFEGSTGVQHHHRSRWGEMLGHLLRLGYWSGRLRRNRPLSGSFLAKCPEAAYLLPAVRVTRVLRRLARAAPREAARAALCLPALLLASLAWAEGFRRGLRAKDGPEAGLPGKKPHTEAD